MRLEMRLLSRLLLLLLLCRLLVEARPTTYIVRVTETAGSKSAADLVDGADVYEQMVAAAMQSSPVKETSVESALPGESLRSYKPTGVILSRYTHALRGFAVTLTPQQASTMASFSNVVGVYPEQVRHLQTTHTPETLGLSTSTGIWPESDYGNDVIIGVLDTGVWPEHRSFRDQGLGSIPTRWKGACQVGQAWTAQNCNKKIIGARFFSAAYEVEVGPINQTLESNSARDDNGHGTHTASTAAGRALQGATYLGFSTGEARGMAPKARLAIYKICWAAGCFDSDILAAFDAAIQDGVDVISFSVGSEAVVELFDDAIAIGSYSAMQRGIFVSASAGNSGPGPATVRNIAPWITTVGAANVDREFSLYVRLGNGKALRGTSMYASQSNSVALPIGNVAVFLNATKNSSASFCLPGSLNPSTVSGKVVVCVRGGGILRALKQQVVLDAGGIGIIGVNLPQDPEERVFDSYLLPGTHLSSDDGIILRDYITSTARPVVSLLAPVRTMLGTKPAPSITTFSSRGPNVLTPQLLKPDLVGPGRMILAAWPQSVAPTLDPTDNRSVEFNIISGTSMSCPHISGLGALLKANHPKWSPAAIRSALMTTASIRDNTESFITDAFTGAPGTPYQFGSGFAQPQKADDPGLIYDLSENDYFNFLCATGQARRNFSNNPCPVNPTKLENFNYPSFSALFRPTSASSKLTLRFKRVVTNVGPAKSTYKGSFMNVPRGYKLSVSPRTLEFTKVNQKKIFTLKMSIPGGPLPKQGEYNTEFAFLTWSDKKHVVRSPIAMAKQL